MTEKKKKVVADCYECGEKLYEGERVAVYDGYYFCGEDDCCYEYVMNTWQDLVEFEKLEVN